MSYNRMSIIGAQEIQTATENITAAIKQQRRRAAILRTVAQHMGGKYVTKHLEPALAALFPDASRTYIYQRKELKHIELTVAYGHRYPSDTCTINLCSVPDRRIDAAALIIKAEQAESAAARLESQLACIDAVAAAYNDVADQYARIYNDAKSLFAVPDADYNLAERYAGMTPDSFARKFAG